MSYCKTCDENRTLTDVWHSDLVPYSVHLQDCCVVMDTRFLMGPVLRGSEGLCGGLGGGDSETCHSPSKFGFTGHAPVQNQSGVLCAGTAVPTPAGPPSGSPSPAAGVWPVVLDTEAGTLPCKPGHPRGRPPPPRGHSDRPRLCV